MKATSQAVDHQALQGILTRYIDSIRGYQLASDLSSESSFIRLCCHLVEIRGADAEELAAVIASTGAEPDLGGSYEADVHRGWIRLLCSAFPGQRRRLLAECLRGEQELLRTLQRVSRRTAAPDRVRTILQDLIYDVEIAIERLQTLGKSHKLPIPSLSQPQLH